MLLNLMPPQFPNPPATWIVPLKNCADEYKKMLTSWVLQGIDGLTKGKPVLVESAAIIRSGGESTQSREGFIFKGFKSPLTDEIYLDCECGGLQEVTNFMGKIVVLKLVVF